MIASWCFGCVRFMIGDNCFARCWYSGCNLIVHSIKYLLHLFLCVVGCVCRMLGMGPGLVSMSPLCSISKCKANVWVMRRFFRSLCGVCCCFLFFFILVSRFVMWLGCSVVFFCDFLECVVLYLFIFLFLFFFLLFCFWARPVGRARLRCFLWVVFCVFLFW